MVLAVSLSARYHFNLLLLLIFVSEIVQSLVWSHNQISIPPLSQSALHEPACVRLAPHATSVRRRDEPKGQLRSNTPIRPRPAPVPHFRLFQVRLVRHRNAESVKLVLSLSRPNALRRPRIEPFPRVPRHHVGAPRFAYRCRMTRKPITTSRQPRSNTLRSHSVAGSPAPRLAASPNLVPQPSLRSVLAIA